MAYIDIEVAKKMLDEYRISRTMSMYGDMDLLMEWRNGVECAMNKLDDVPTADVAPKSEVERLQKHNTEYARKHYEDGYNTAKSEVASEIFAEILKIKGLELHDWLAIAELKKKYTEGHNEQEKGKRE
jgi:hypothetical protein